MRIRAQSQVQASAAQTVRFTPVRTGLLQRACACGQHTLAGGECAECRKKREATLQRAAVNTAPVNEVPPIVHEVLRSPGQPLDPATRAFMEPRFGYDFSRVQVHTDARAAESARAVNALAYTVGRDVVFGAGQYVPHTTEGERLVAHELMHVVQQGLEAQASAAILRRQGIGSGQDPIHEPLIEEYRRAHGLPLNGRDPGTGEPVGPSEAELKYGGVLDAWLRTRGGGTTPTSGCLPTVLNPQWDVASAPILMNFPASRCAMQLAKRFAPTGSPFGVNGMEFKGQLSVPRGCPGRFYFVQYTQPDRALVGCLEGRELAECIRPGWGLDGSWPYGFGSTVDTAARAGATVDVTSVDSPGIRNISNPALEFVRHCISDEQFVTYLVFEDAAHHLTPLGWMNWQWSARALRGNGRCPPASLHPDCTDWTLTGTGSKLGERFASGAVGPQPLNRSTAAVSLLSSTCPASSCPLTASASPPPSSTPGRGTGTAGGGGQALAAMLQRASLNPSPAHDVPPIVHEVLRSPGQPLDENTCAFMEPRFGYDFSSVRVHTNAKAAESAQAVNALAYTVGRDVVFGNDEFAPDTPAGRKLIAHELVHVLQQSEQSQSLAKSLHLDSSHSVTEREADMMAEKAVSGRQMQPAFFSTSQPSVSTLVVQRTPTFSPDCTEYDRCRVIEPLGAANQLLDRVLAELPPVVNRTVTSGRIIDLLNVHFHDPAATATRAVTVLANFQAIKAELNSTINFNCNPPPADCEVGEGSEGRVGAFTSSCSPGSDISLCNAYYNTPCIEQARLLIHEMTHNILSSCTDYAYLHQSNYMALRPEQTSRNPDTYAQFAKMVFLGAPSCRECSAEVQLRPGQY